MFVEEKSKTIPTKVNDMNIKNQFVNFMAEKADEFVATKSSLSLSEMRDLIEVIDSFSIDLNNLPKLVDLPNTKRIRHKSNITNSDIVAFIFAKVSNGQMATRKELYHSVREYFGSKITEGDFAKSTGGVTKINTRIYKQVGVLLKSGRLAMFVSKDGKHYIHRTRPYNTQSEEKVVVTY